MTAPTPSPDAGLRERLASVLAACQIEHDIDLDYDGVQQPHYDAVDALLAGPLADHLAATERAREEAEAKVGKLEGDLRAAEREVGRLTNEADGEFVQAACEVMRAYEGLDPRDYCHEGITADDFRSLLVEDMAEAWRQTEDHKGRLAATQAENARLVAAEASLETAIKQGIRAWSARLHIPVTRMASRVLREEIQAARAALAAVPATPSASGAPTVER